MVYILSIPLFYQASSYPFRTSSSHPTTTARYIALLLPSTSTSPNQALTDRNSTIAKDAIAWGWKVYSADPTLPRMLSWWAKYSNEAQKSNWDNDIWRIWQREHGVRILERGLRIKGEREGGQGSMSTKEKAAKRARKVGDWVKRTTHVMGSTEFELRQLEDAKTRARRAEKRRREIVGGNGLVGASTVSIPGSLVGRLEGLKLIREASGEGISDDVVGLQRRRSTTGLGDPFADVLEGINPFQDGLVRTELNGGNGTSTAARSEGFTTDVPSMSWMCWRTM
ncbi:hypothetical protein EJ02DRAFT_481926 [Clathrospora elynae]|uniref:Uncharacterized protein n=1 Tax=Clathrospora elynae TaxID=706981 RepID=A0A6A5T0Z1_9PLEO|nr:hypothetical protein EJ02DRAFT_481926 [Clathrospora elynae]